MNSKAAYKTKYGMAFHGDSLELLKELDDNSVDLVITSPPFALQRQKAYGNKDQDEYVNWLLNFTEQVHRVIKETGSFVIDLGGAYKKGCPVRSLYNYRILIQMCDQQGFNLAEEFFWFNPAKLPGPIEWVNKRKMRAKDAVNTVWWMSKSEFPNADISNVLAPYSDRMEKLLKNKTKYYDPKKRPSGHDISEGFNTDRGGAIPSNLLSIPNTGSTGLYLRRCKEIEVKGHPARFPEKLPEFFIRFLTKPGDLVLDIFAGSNTTGEVAESYERRWMSFELEREYVAASALRFADESLSTERLRSMFSEIMEEENVELEIPQGNIQESIQEKIDSQLFFI